MRGNCIQADEGEQQAAKYEAVMHEPGLVSEGLGGPEMLLPIGAEGKAAEEGAAAAEAVAPVVKAVAAKITGYTRHSLNQALAREGVGVSTKAILDAVRSPTSVINQAGGAVRYVGENAVVILNQAGKVITTWARNSAGWRQIP